MPVEKKILSYRIYSPDISSGRKWFVEWYEGKKRIRKYGDINCFDNHAQRMLAAQKIIEQYALQDHVVKDMALKERAYKYLVDNRGVWRKKSYQTFKSKLDTFYSIHGDAKPNRESIKNFFTWLKNNRHKTTHNTYLQALKMIFAAAGEESLFDGIQRIRSVKTPARYFQGYQIRQLKKVMLENDPELWLFVQFQYYCFIRPNSELRLLKVSDLLLDDHKILVRADISKNGKAEYVSIPELFRPHLTGFRERSPGELLFHKPGDPFMPCGYNHFTNRHMKILKILGYDRSYKLYSWKHTGAVSCIRAGISVKDLQIQLRHHSLEEVDKYLRQLGVSDLSRLENKFPGI